jgi:hypothetical protein
MNDLFQAIFGFSLYGAQAAPPGYEEAYRRKQEAERQAMKENEQRWELCDW